MPRRASPGHRERIDGALNPVLRAALAEMCALLNIWDWRQSPLSAPFTQAAVVLLAAQLVADGACSEKDSIDRAAIALGVSPDTVRSRARRWPVDSRALCTPTPALPDGIVQRREPPRREVA
jgi:hypothetical protein